MISPNVLEPALNRIPQDIHHVHIMGICGTGMAALAGMLKEKGYTVTGSDENVYPPMSDFLAASDIPVLKGYGPENLEKAPDLVVVGNVIRAVNPEAVRLKELRLPYVSMPQALAHFFIQDHCSLVVAGTHGKTTTSSLLASVLHSCGSTPGFMIGGIVEAFSKNFSVAGDRFFVVEGDEYDTAFFDKGSKFLHYRPDYAIITSIEFDHADIFTDLEMIKHSFSRFVDLVPVNGLIVACGDDPVVLDVLHKASCRVITYGRGEHCQWRVVDHRSKGLQSQFAIHREGKLYGEFNLPMPGMHNVLNATSVVALLHYLGFETDAVSKGLASFEGVKRRQQVRGEVNDIMVIDDFAHHPTAVRETVKALKSSWPDRRLIVVFEPRTNSSRRSVFQNQYAQSFDQSDMVVVREHIPLDTVPASEQFSSGKLVETLRAAGKSARYFADTDAIIDFLGDNCLAGDVVAVLSNGGFDNIHERLLERFR